MVEFTDKVTSKKFYKFGWTNHSDVLKRFQDPQYDPFEIRAIASVAGTPEEVQAMESVLLSFFPKNIWLENYLGDERTWNGLSGITEIVNLTEQQYQHACKSMHRLKDRVNAIRLSRLDQKT